MQCPKCHSSQIAKDGRTHDGKQRFHCQDCQRQFVAHPSRQPIDQATRDWIEKLLQERLALAAMVCITDVSAQWLPMDVHQNTMPRRRR